MIQKTKEQMDEEMTGTHQQCFGALLQPGMYENSYRQDSPLRPKCSV